MDRVGGYLAYRALEDDPGALDDVLLVMRAESEAAQIERSRQEAETRRAQRGR